MKCLSALFVWLYDGSWWLRRRWAFLARGWRRVDAGVHSPFAFGFLRDVLMEDGRFYAYDGADAGRLGGFFLRLANFVQPCGVCLLEGAPTDAGRWLKFGENKIKFVGLDFDFSVGDFLVVGSGEDLAVGGWSLRGEGLWLVVCDPWRSWASRAAVRGLMREGGARFVWDAWDVVVLFWDGRGEVSECFRCGVVR